MCLRAAPVRCPALSSQLAPSASLQGGLWPAAPRTPTQHHPPGCDKVQQPVGPDLLDATVRDGAHVSQVELLIPAEVILVSLVMRQRGARERTGNAAAFIPPPPDGPAQPAEGGCVFTQ